MRVKSYNEFESIDEGFGRFFKDLPVVIPGLIFGSLFNIELLLRNKWRDLKDKTKDSEYYPPFVSVEFMDSRKPKKIESNLTKLSTSDVIARKLKLHLFLTNWNVYLSSQRDIKTNRQIIFLSKDDISKGDVYLDWVLEDKRIYTKDFFNKFLPHNPEPISKRLKDPDNMPIFIVVAKYDNIDKANDIRDYINDICIDLQDDGYRIETDITPTIDRITIKINLIKSINYSDDNPLIKDINEIALRVNHYLNTEGIYYDYKVIYRCTNSIFYCGTAGRFITRALNGEIITGIIDAAKKEDANNVSISNLLPKICYKKSTDEKGAYDKYQGNGVYLSNIYGQNEDLILTADDIKSVLSDPKNCYLGYTSKEPIRDLNITIGDYIKIDFRKN